MSWLKLSDNFFDECAGLSDAAVRTHVEGLSWVMRRESGGLLVERDVRRFAETPDVAGAVRELLAAGFWIREGRGYQILHHMEHQPEPDLIAKRRKVEAERQRRRRRKLAGLIDEPAPRTGVTTGVTTRVTRNGTERNGETRYEEKQQEG